MGALQNIYQSIAATLGKLKPAERLLIASFAVILVMALFLVSQYAGKPEMVPLFAGAPIEDQQRAQAYMVRQGVAHDFRAGALVVPKAQKDALIAQLAAENLLPSDKAGFLKTLIDNQKWSNTRQQNEQIFGVALKQELEKIIAALPDVKSASVVIDAPEPVGLGAAVRKPTASVAVFTKSGSPLEQKLIDSIAALVGGAKAGLSPDRVRIIDQTGQRKARSESDSIPTTYLEHAARVENETRDKISAMLAYIPGVIVAVSAQVDVSRVASKVSKHLPKDDGTLSLIRKETKTESTSTSGSRAAEPGVRSNQPVDINRGSTISGGGSETSDKDSEYENHVGTKVDEILDPRGMPTSVAVSVNIPRGYVLGLFTAENKDAKPTEADLQKRFDEAIKPRVAESILPHIRTMTQQSGAARPADADLAAQVVVSMVPLDLPAAETQQAGVLGGILGGSSSGTLGLGGGILEKGLVALLGVVAVGLMFSMVRKAGAKAELPTAEELVGLPPALETKTDLIGEADESDTPLAGIEVEEGAVRSSKLLEQVSEIVGKDPEAAAKLLKRWISAEE